MDLLFTQVLSFHIINTLNPLKCQALISYTV
jgi:hypothetical protein